VAKKHPRNLAGRNSYFFPDLSASIYLYDGQRTEDTGIAGFAELYAYP
jgi:hypothetical protein